MNLSQFGVPDEFGPKRSLEPAVIDESDLDSAQLESVETGSLAARHRYGCHRVPPPEPIPLSQPTRPLPVAATNDAAAATPGVSQVRRPFSKLVGCSSIVSGVGRQSILSMTSDG